MDFSSRFDLWYLMLQKSPRDDGEVCALVLRPQEGGSGARKIVEVAEFSPECGMHGDRWATDERRTGEDQVTLINIHVISSLEEDPQRRALSGDNLQVDLDLSEANLPAGTLLEIGTSVLVVSPQPHNPCKQFLSRFGELAVKKVLRANKKERRGRGVLCMVEQAGEIRVGDSIRVQRSAAE